MSPIERTGAAFTIAGAMLILAPAVFAEPTPKPTLSRMELDMERVRAQLPQGPFTVKFENGLVTLDADKSWKVGVLIELGKQAGFQATGGGADRSPFTMKFERVPLEEAIRRIAGRDGYWLNYEYQEPKGYVVKTLLIGNRALNAGNAARLRKMAKQAVEKREAKKREAAEALRQGGAAGGSEPAPSETPKP